MTLTLIRHTPVAVPSGLCYGRTDVALAPTFAADAARVRQQLRSAPSLVLTSPATRCLRLAHELGAGEVRVDERLLELDFGTWENRRWDDIPRAEMDAWADAFVDAAPPGGESFRGLARRMDSFRREYEATEAVVVTHAGIIRAWVCLIEGRPLKEAFQRRVEYGACIPVEPYRPAGNLAPQPPVNSRLGTVRTKHCGRCGADFLCGPAPGRASCWCDDLPHVGWIAGAAHDCLCPECLRAAIADRAGHSC
jgi:alpha-ribazole phosphatase